MPSKNTETAMKLFKYLAAFLLIFSTNVCLTSCGDDEDENTGTQEVPVETISESIVSVDVDNKEASIPASLVPEGGKAVLTATPSVKGDVVAMNIVGSYDVTKKKFVFDLTAFVPGVTYLCAISIYNLMGRPVKTISPLVISTANEAAVICPNAAHPHAINLDLPRGTRWSCCNVGALYPEGYGYYFSWGIADGHDPLSTQGGYYFDRFTYKWYNGLTYTKYNSTDRLDKLEDKDNAALNMMGQPWSMPTRNDIDELLGNTIHKWITLNDVNGVLLTSKTNGQSIFLPAAGNYEGIAIKELGRFGYYWASTRLGSDLRYADQLNIGPGYPRRDYFWRYYGCSVRAVIH